MTTNHLDAAHTYAAAGLAPIPVRTDGTKQPAVPWKQFQHAAPSADQIDRWWGDNPAMAVGIVCGAASGGMEMLELEGRAAHRATDILDHLRAAGHTHIADLLAATWTVHSPSGGWHWHYRLHGTNVPGNTRIAWTRDGDTFAVAAETRGQGGYTIAPPSGGTTHPTGKPWTTITGAPDTIATLTADQRATLHATIAELIDEKPSPATPPAPQAAPTPVVTRPADGDRPGDAIDTHMTWEQILCPHGWTIHHHGPGEEIFWTRPGKNPRDGHSATTGHADDRDRMWIFSSSVPELEPETPHTKFHVYAALNHGGDHSKARQALLDAGIGQQRTGDITINFPVRHSATQPPQTGGQGGADGEDGNLAPVVNLVSVNAVEHTDDANALQLVARHGHELRYAGDRGRWLAWDGARWRMQDDTAAAAREAAKLVGRSLPADSKEDRAHRRKTLSANGITNMLIQARTHPAIAVSYTDLDADPYALCTPAGIVDLRTGTLGPANPDALCTKSTAVQPDWDCPTPLWDQFLDTTFAGQDPMLVPYLQRLLGDSIIGRVKYHVLPFLHGAGANGKSTLMDTIVHILGDYAGSAPAGFLMAGQQQHETEIARLSALRLVVASEVNERDRFDEAKVKMLTGGDTLTARFMRQDHFTFTPSHSLWLMGNSQPRVGTGGTSFWRRLRLINFANVIDEADRIPDLGARLVGEEAPGILAWLIDGAKQSIDAGIDTPDSVRATTADYATEEDALGLFVAEHLTFAPALEVPVTKVVTAYRSWCDANGEKPMTSQNLGRELRTRFGVGGRKSNGTRYLTGVSLLAREEQTDGYSTGF